MERMSELAEFSKKNTTGALSPPGGAQPQSVFLDFKG